MFVVHLPPSLRHISLKHHGPLARLYSAKGSGDGHLLCPSPLLTSLVGNIDLVPLRSVGGGGGGFLVTRSPIIPALWGPGKS